MTKTIVTSRDGTTTQSSDVVYVVPEREQARSDLDAMFPDMNGAFIADMLSAFLAHERAGRALYRTAAERTNNPMLKSRYQEFGEETEDHIRILEDTIRQLGGNPAYVSPPARATEGMDSKLLESTFLLSGSVDIMQQEMVLLDAVLSAEAIDHANWEALSDLTNELPEGQARDTLREAVGQVEPQEDEHLSWVRDMRCRMIIIQARSKAMAKAGAKAEEMVAAVRDWFS